MLAFRESPNVLPVAAEVGIFLLALKWILRPKLIIVVVGVVALALLSTSSVPTAIDTTPEAGQRVYRVWGGLAPEEGGSWTPVDPTTLGPDRYRVEAGLPDRRNDGTHLAIGILRDPTKILIVRRSLPVDPSDEAAPGPSYRHYDGGLPEYVIPNAAGIDIIESVDLSPAYGGVPVGCTPSVPTARGCI